MTASINFWILLPLAVLRTLPGEQETRQIQKEQIHKLIQMQIARDLPSNKTQQL